MKSPPCPLSASHPHCRQQHYFGWAFSAVGRRSPGRRGTGTYVRCCWPTWTWDACVQTNRANKEERHSCGWLGGKNRPINQFYLKFILTLAATTTTTTKEKQALVDFGEESSQEQAFLCVVVGDFYGFLFFKWRFSGGERAVLFVELCVNDSITGMLVKISMCGVQSEKLCHHHGSQLRNRCATL